MCSDRLLVDPLQGTHVCACLAGAFGDGGPARAASAQAQGCTFCPANAMSPDASLSVMDCVCATGYGVAGDGTNQAVTDANTACDLVTCPLHSTRASDGTDVCACDVGYTVEPALDAGTNTYAAVAQALDACSVCDVMFWNEVATGLCLPCTTCAGGTFESAACGLQADTVCTACTTVASAVGSDTPNDPADDATYTCTAMDDSRVSSCLTGLFKTVGQDVDPNDANVQETSDTCTACSTCAGGTFESVACTADADTGCTACTTVAGSVGDNWASSSASVTALTCESATMSRLVGAATDVCYVTYTKVNGTDAEALARYEGTPDACECSTNQHAEATQTATAMCDLDASTDASALCATGCDASPLVPNCRISAGVGIGAWVMDPANNGVCPPGCDDTAVECTPVCAFASATAATCVESATASVAADVTSCSAVTALTDTAACSAVMTAASATTAACTYTAVASASARCPAGCTIDQNAGAESCTGTASPAAVASALCNAAGSSLLPSCVGAATPVPQCVGTSTQDQICVDNVSTRAISTTTCSQGCF